jgi:ATP-dependent protease HslVU (ClpYQ) ATPase subunit
LARAGPHRCGFYRRGAARRKDREITPAYVRERLGALVADEDLTRYIL